MGQDLYTYTFMADVGQDTNNDGVLEFDGVMDRIEVRPGPDEKPGGSFDWEATVEYATNAQKGAKYTAPENLTVEKGESMTGLFTPSSLKGSPLTLIATERPIWAPSQNPQAILPQLLFRQTQRQNQPPWQPYPTA